jgi:SAM-dependent methyltransferase/uncharacterized protein YbaR (Trm112 family)
MNQQLLEILICPSCEESVQLFVIEGADIDSGHMVTDQRGQEVISGLLQCKCGSMYPIIEGVPRFLEGGLNHFPAFVEHYRPQLERICGCQHRLVHSVMSQVSDDYENIRDSFSKEWGLFNYNGDKTWGWTLEERIKVFQGDINMTPEELVGKRLLDAGCGNGTLTAALSDLGLQVVGIDLNDGLGLANCTRAKFSAKAKENVQYIQGNLLQPPLKMGVFDIVYSSGVIHHTPSSKRAFERLVSLTRKGGRLYIWVYGKRAFLVRMFFKFGRYLKNRISLRSLVNFCRLLAPFYKVATETLNFLRIVEFRKRTTSEITLDLFDAFAPRFNHWHTETEVRLWFQEFGFKNINVSGRQKHGFGMYGDRT